MVTKEFAHYHPGMGQFSEGVTFGDLHAAIDVVVQLARKYLARDIRPLPRESVRYVEKINDLRNAVAHAFFPENLRGERTTYNGVDVFTIQGFRALRAGRDDALDPLFRRAYGIRR